MKNNFNLVQRFLLDSKNSQYPQNPLHTNVSIFDIKSDTPSLKCIGEHQKIHIDKPITLLVNNNNNNIDENVLGTPSKPPYFSPIWHNITPKNVQSLKNFEPTQYQKNVAKHKLKQLVSKGLANQKSFNAKFIQIYQGIKAYITLTLGIQFTLVQCVCTSIAALFISYVKSISPLEITVIRFIFQLLACIPILLYCKQTLRPNSWGEFGSLSFRSIMTIIGITAMVYSYHYIPISDANAICRTSPLFVIIIGFIFLREERNVKPFDIAIILTTIIGVIFITRPQAIFGVGMAKTSITQPPSVIANSSVFHNQQKHNQILSSSSQSKHHSTITGVVFALTSAITISFSMVFVKRNRETPLAVNMFYFSVQGIVLLGIIGISLHLFSLPPCLGTANTNDGNNIDRSLVIGASVFGTLSQIFLYLGLQHERVGIVAALNATAIIYSQLLQIWFQHIMPHWTSWVGTIVIMLSIVCYGLRKWTLTAREKGPLISQHLF